MAKIRPFNMKRKGSRVYKNPIKTCPVNPIQHTHDGSQRCFSFTARSLSSMGWVRTFELPGLTISLISWTGHIRPLCHLALRFLEFNEKIVVTILIGPNFFAKARAEILANASISLEHNARIRLVSCEGHMHWLVLTVSIYFTGFWLPSNPQTQMYSSLWDL